jgi:predicted secreted protein
MPIYSMLAVYFIVWWLVLFMVLPFGVRTHAEEGDVVLGTTSSAPANLNLVRKMIITSIISAVIVYGIWYAYVKMGWTAEAVATRFAL